MNSQHKHFYEFGGFRLDPKERRLQRNGQTLSLTPKAFDVLLLLVENEGHVLRKDEFLEKVWAGSYVEEKNLADNISLLRKVLGDNPKEPAFIETVSRLGYRFVADVQEVEEDGADVLLHERERGRFIVEDEHDAAPAGAELIEVTGRKSLPAPVKSRNRTALVVLTLALGIGVVLGALALWRNRQQGTAPVTRSIAVLPFKPLVAESADPALELGITDALISKLSNIRQVVVRPTNSVLKYTSEEQDLQAAGRELGVDVILDGRVQKAGDRIRLSVQLIRAADGVPMWAEKFDHEFKDIFTVQDAISARVADALALKLTGEEKKGLAKRYTDNVEAYQLYLKGHHHWGTFNRSELLTSINYYNEALKIDPNYALAYTGLANAYSVIGIYGPLPASEAMPKAREAVEKAIALDDELAEAHSALGGNKIFYERDWPGAEREFKRAMALNPNLTDPHSLYGYWLQAMGRADEAVAEIRRAKELAPTWFVPNRDYLWGLLMARRYDEAIEQSRQMARLEPADYFAYCVLGEAYTFQGRYEEAEAEFHRALVNVKERPVRLLAALGYLHAVTGKKDEASKLIAQLNERSESRPLIYIAQVYAGLGERDRAFATLDEAYKERYPMLWRVKVQPEFDSLRSDSRYAELMRKLNLE